MTDPAVNWWINRFGPVFSRLVSAVSAVAAAANHARRVIDSGGAGHQVDDRLLHVGVAAAGLLAAVSDAQRLPPIPDETAHHYFTLGLQWWGDGAAAALAATRRYDAAQVSAAAEAIAAGSEALQRAAARLERAGSGEFHRPV